MKWRFLKLGKQGQDRSKVEEDSTSGSLARSPPKRFGLFKLPTDESVADTNNHEHYYPVNIIAVHGLNGGAYTTWTHDNGTFWLQDFLPKLLPGCRVYTYGYPSQFAFSKSLAEVQEYSRLLLSSIRDEYENWDLGSRTIIFVCHSLGGIVFKQALVIAHEDDVVYGEILKSIAGVVFLGTPHNGSGVANFANTVGKIINAIITTASSGVQTRAIRTDLFNYLKYDSKALKDLDVSVRNRFHDLTVVSFCETEQESPFPFPIVDKYSSTLGIPGEEIIPLGENHRSICRFGGETESYKNVSRSLRRIARNALAREQAFKRTSIPSSDRTLDDSEKTCFKQLGVFDVADVKRISPSPAKGTCQWILGHPRFVCWLDQTENTLLWLTGRPGCGKTIMSLFLAKQLEEARSNRAPSNVCVFFCNDRLSAEDILNGLIFQIISRHRSLIRHVKREFEIQGQHMFRSFTTLWNLLVKIATDPKSATTSIIIDALDECKKITRDNLLLSIRDFTNTSSDSTGSKQHVKFILTGRPELVHLEKSVGNVAEHEIVIDEGQTGYDRDLRIFIQQRLDEICQRHNLSHETMELLRQSLYSKAGQTFLWVHMVLESLESSLLASKKDIQNIITQIPPALEKTYLCFLSEIPSKYISKALMLLKLIVGSLRPLTLDEINIAFAIDATHRTLGEVTSNCQPAILLTIQGILGPLARVSDNKVMLVHPSAKEFLLQRKSAGGDFPAIYAISEEESAALTASACMHYLLLKDFSVDLFELETSPTESNSDYSDMIEGSVVSIPYGSFWNEGTDDLDAFGLFKDPGLLDAEICQALVSKYALYQYASLHWTEHFALCETTAPVELRETAKKLLDTETLNCSNWLRVFSAEFDAIGRSIPNKPDKVTLAAYFGLHETLNDLVSSDKSIPPVQRDQALFWAAHEGHVRNVSILLGVDADPNARSSNRETALIAAARNNHLNCVVTLLADQQTHLNIRGPKGRTALAFSCSSGHDQVVKELLSRNDCMTEEEDDSGATALFWAIGGSYISIVSELANLPTVDINHRDKKGRTPLSWAAGDGMEEVVKVLLNMRDIDSNLEDSNGRSPLSWAAGNGCTAAVRVLLRNNEVDKASLDKDQRNAISWASAGGHSDTLRMLLNRGCPGVDIKDVDGWTPLAWAIQNDSPGTVEVLLSSGSVNLEQSDHSGRTPLFWAVEYGHIEVIRILLREGADPERQSHKGETPLIRAEKVGRADISDELLNHVRQGGSMTHFEQRSQVPSAMRR